MSRLFRLLEVNEEENFIPALHLNTNGDICEKLNDTETLIYLADTELGELEVSEFDLISYIDVGVVRTEYSQKFHYMALLYYLVDLLNISRLIENKNFIRLLYTCMNVRKTKSDSICCFAVSIVIKCIDGGKFAETFTKDFWLLQFCSIPFCLFAASQVSALLASISKNSCIMSYISKNVDIATLIMNYAMNCYPYSENEDSCIFLINSFKYSEFYYIFVNIGGIIKLLHRIKLVRLFVKLKNEPNNGDSLDMHKAFYFFVNYVIKTVLYHFFIQLRALLGSDVIECLPNPDPYCINYDLCDKILKYHEKNGGLTSNAKFLEEFFQPEIIETFLLILLIISERISESNDIEIYKESLYILKFISLHNNAKKAFMLTTKIYLGQHAVTYNLIYYLNYQLDTDFYKEHVLKMKPFDVYTNLLMSCFPSFLAYKIFLKQNNLGLSYDFEDIDIKLDEKSKLFIESILKGNILCQIFEFLVTDDVSQCNFSAKVSAIRLLYLLTIKKRVLQILSRMRNYFNYKILKTLIGIYLHRKANHEAQQFFKFLCKIVNKINKYFGKQQVLASYVLLYKKCWSQNDFENVKISLINFKNDYEKIEESLSEENKFCDHFHIKNDTEVNNSEIKSFCQSRHISSNNHKSLKSIEKIGCVKSYTFVNKIRRYRSIYERSNFTNFHYQQDSAVCAKILIDGKIVVSLFQKLLLYKNNSCDRVFNIYSTFISHIHDSVDGQFIVGSGTNVGSIEVNTLIWKYDKARCIETQQPVICVPNLYYSKFTRDNKQILGVTNYLEINMYDLNKNALVMKFTNDFPNCYRFTSIEMNQDNNIILFNGALYCVRSGKLIHSFPPFNAEISGIFMPSDLEVIIHTEHWDLRTFRLFKIRDDLNGIHLQRTYIPDLIIGKPIIPDPYFSKSLQRIEYFNFSGQSFKKSIKIYESKYLTTLKNFQLINGYDHCDVSRDGSKILLCNSPKYSVSNYEILTLIDLRKDSNNHLNLIDPTDQQHSYEPF